MTTILKNLVSCLQMRNRNRKNKKKTGNNQAFSHDFMDKSENVII